MNKKFYVYYHKNPENNQVQYVGKGQGRRAYSLNKRGNVHLNWISLLAQKSLKPVIEIVEYFDNENDALNKEVQLIKYYKDLGIQLLNISEGGSPGAGLTGSKNGAYGKKRLDLIKRNKANKGKTILEIYGEKRATEIRKTLSKATTGENNPMYGKSGETAPCFGRNGELHPMYGKKHKKESKLKISASLRENRGTKILCSNGIIYASLTQAAEELHIGRKCISEILKKTKNSHKGLTFQYVSLNTGNPKQSLP